MHLKKIGKILFITFSVVLLLIILLFKGVDKSPKANNLYYQKTKQHLDSFEVEKHIGNAYEIGWSKANITPKYPLDLAGFKPRGKSDSIADSLYVRTLYISNKKMNVAIVSYDLLMVHPIILDKVNEGLKDLNIKVYYSATHTHNSFGNWSPDLLSSFILGSYKDSVVESLAQKTVKTVLEAKQRVKNSTISYFEFHNPSQVMYRLKTTGGIVDDLVRGIKIKRSDSSEAILSTFSAHPTTLNRNANYISGDYPGKLNELLEKKVEFSIFCAGAVGSHGPLIKGEMSLSNKDEYARKLAQAIINHKNNHNKYISDFAMSFYRFNMFLREPHLRLNEYVRIRPWLFNTIIGDLTADIQVLQLGDIIFMGMPCDFSGELISQLNVNEKQLILTSFNGNYIGYITKDSLYDQKLHEIEQMNWFGPYNGAYFVEMMNGLLEKHY